MAFLIPHLVPESLLEMLNNIEEVDEKKPLQVGTEFLEERGFSPIGTGSTSCVFTHPSVDWVVKYKKQNKHGEAYEYYVNALLSQNITPKTYPGLPHVYASSARATILEKLEPWSGDHPHIPENSAQRCQSFYYQAYFDASEDEEAVADYLSCILENERAGCVKTATFFEQFKDKNYDYLIDQENALIRPETGDVVLVDPMY